MHKGSDREQVVGRGEEAIPFCQDFEVEFGLQRTLGFGAAGACALSLGEFEPQLTSLTSSATVSIERIDAG